MRRVLQGAVVQIEAIHIEESLHASVLPIENAGAAPERAAPRPVTEVSKRDVV
jgi:hypothetical protein